jgi:colanic acid biosynthesis glycosyl transferase WcaI
MRILIYGINFTPELTGIGKYTGELAQFLAQHSQQIRVVTAPPYYPHWKIMPPYSGWRYKQEQMDGIRVFRCPIWVPAKPSGLNRILHLASFGLSTLPVMLSQIPWKPDIVICIAPAIFCAPAAWITAHFSRAQAWLHIQDFELEAAVNLKFLPGSGFLVSMLKKIEAVLLQRFDIVSTISQRMLQRLWQKGVPDQKTYLLPNWVDCKVIFPLSRPSPMRDEIGATPDQIVILYSGNLGKKQGLELLIAAAHALQNETSLLFVICGNGSARSYLEKQAENMPNIRFMDLKPIEQLNDLLNAADVHVLVQRAETADLVMPSKLSGMLASGRPVIATATHGTELAAVIEETGVLVSPENLPKLTQAILSLAQDVSRRENLGKQGLQFVLTHWEKELVLEGLLSKLRYNTVRK